MAYLMTPKLKLSNIAVIWSVDYYIVTFATILIALHRYISFNCDFYNLFQLRKMII